MTKRNLLFIGFGIASVFFIFAAGAIFLYNSTETLSSLNFDVPSFISDLPFFGDQSQDDQSDSGMTIGNPVDLEVLFAPMWESRVLLQDNFLYQPVDDLVLSEGAIEGLLITLGEAGIDPSEITIPASAASIESISSQAGTPIDAYDAFAPFWEIWQKIEYANYQGTYTYTDLLQSSLSYMVNALGDDYTSYMDPIQHEQSQRALQGEYEGIGAWVDPSGDYLTITAPMAGSPAEKAGLLPGDQVIAIDGKDMTGIDGNIVITKVIGPAGSTVVLTIKRDNLEPFDVSIVRGNIVPPTVETKMLDGDIAYLQLFSFNGTSDVQVREALEELIAQNPKGLIFDLRNNGGGFLHTAVTITSEFLESGVVLHEEYGNGTRDTYEVKSGGIATNIPLVVLVNEGTASASEIFAGAIQDYDRGKIVGSVTFGKGLVQLPITLSNGQGSLRITIARWLTPEDRTIHGDGLIPDYLIDFPSLEDQESGIDPQLDKAIEIIQAQLGQK